MESPAFILAYSPDLLRTTYTTGPLLGKSKTQKMPPESADFEVHASEKM